MLLLNKVLWDSDKILKCKSSDDWDAPDTQVLVDCVLNEVVELLKSNNDKRVIFIIDCNNGALPTPYYLGKIFTFLKGIRPLLSEKLDFSILYSKKKEDEHIIDMILKMYSPVRPIHKCLSKEAIKELISNRDNTPFG
jgi:hypothetical protein